MQDYAEIFLERADLLKYQMYQLLARPYVKDVSITDLATLSHGKYQPIYNVFQELLDDLVGLTKKPRETVRAALLAADKLPLSLDAYRAYLVQQGVVYRLIDYVVQQPNPSLNQFCEQEYISRSTITRKIKPLNRMLAQYGVKLRLASFAFSGPEFNVRYCLYTIYWWAYRGVSWPFSLVKRADVAAERNLISIGTSQPLAKLQQLYFLALCHLRVAKNARLKASDYLEHFEAMINTQQLRQGSLRAPFTWLDDAAFNFFQVSQPRFDVRTRAPQTAAIETSLLTDPTVATVSDALIAELHDSGAGDLDDDLYLNLLRLVAGYVMAGGAFPQGQDYIGGGHESASDKLIMLVKKVVATLPETTPFAGFHHNVDHFAYSVSRLVTPALPEDDRQDRLHVRLAIDPVTEGYRVLSGFVNCVPWIATVSGNDSDLVIATGDEADAGESAFMWYANALELRPYQESLIATLMAEHDHKCEKEAQVC
ncbi:helix-turn-helix domain-containing protein [Lacticaseibacillus sp. GG6-2]